MTDLARFRIWHAACSIPGGGDVMQMDFWQGLAVREFSDVAERASELLEEADDAEEAVESEPPLNVPVDFF